MTFTSIAQIIIAIKKLPKTQGSGRTQYSILFKKGVVEFGAKKKITAHTLAAQLSLNNSTVHNWFAQYDDGLYSLEGAYSVSSRMKGANDKIIASLDKQIQDLAAQKKLIEEATKLGLVVSVAKQK